MPVSTSKFFHDEGTKLVTVSVVISYSGAAPERKDLEEAIDHLLSSIPGAAESNGKDLSMKSEMMSGVRSTRTLKEVGGG